MLKSREILKDETQNTPTISSSIYYSNPIAITFKFNRNFPVQILQVTMEFVAIASFEFLLRTQRTRLLFIWKYNKKLWETWNAATTHVSWDAGQEKKGWRWNQHELEIKSSGNILLHVQT